MSQPFVLINDTRFSGPVEISHVYCLSVYTLALTGRIKTISLLYITWYGNFQKIQGNTRPKWVISNSGRLCLAFTLENIKKQCILKSELSDLLIVLSRGFSVSSHLSAQAVCFASKSIYSKFNLSSPYSHLPNPRHHLLLPEDKERPYLVSPSTLTPSHPFSTQQPEQYFRTHLALP